jgi:hypothetical protein
MSSIEYQIYEIPSDGLSGFGEIEGKDSALVRQAEITKTFDPNNHFIELSYFTLNNVRINTFANYRDYSILTGDTQNDSAGSSEVVFDVKQDYLKRGFQGQEVKVIYNFLNYIYSDDFNPQDFYIESISPDRKEIRILPVNLDSNEVEEITDTIIDRFEDDLFLPDLTVYFRDNIFFKVVNVDKETFRGENTAVLLKLYEPLPTAISVGNKLNIVEKISDSVAYEINTTITPDEINVPYLRGANFSAEIQTQAVEPSRYFSCDELFSFPTNNTYRELNALLNEKGAELGIDYSDFSNFINFSSAEERLRNFKYKLDLIESYQTSLDIIENTSSTYTLAGISGSRNYYEGLLNGIVNNFDHYERHLYFTSGSTAWPKSNNLKPFINKLSTTTEAETWYSGEISDAILYDAQNQDLLANTIPSFLREDNENRPYEIFIHMIAQHFDNLWIYTDAISKKYDADNRLTRGVSKDLIEDLLKNFGVKLYTSNRSLEDLFKYFTFSSYEFGNELITNNQIAEPTDITSENDYQKQIYKRIYHNLSLLMKSKGTERGLRALINCFGIPSDILKIRVFGGKNRTNLPFFGGEKSITGSIDKVRLNNTGSIVPGDTVSFYTTILNDSNDFTQDLHRVEIGFSPTHNIDNYIVSQSAVLFPNEPFNLDQYIGDPRGYESNSYFDLREHSKVIFDNVEAYNVKDFVRLIKFFDNVLFRMVRDFVPARTVTDTGIIIKSHLLERSKFNDPRMTWSQSEFTSSIDTGFISGSNAGAFSNIGFYSINNELATSHYKKVRTPSGSKFVRLNNFDLDNASEKVQIARNFEEAKFDGEFKNSKIRVTNGNLNGNNPFLQLDYPTVTYNVQFYSEIPDDVCILQTTYSGPFVVDNNTTLNIPNSNIFSGDNSFYSFAVDNQTVTPPNFTFTGEQYDEFIVTATHPDSSLENALTGESTCEGSRIVKIVKCDINTNQGIPISPLSVNTNYNFFNFFFQSLTLNSELTYFVNGTNIGTTDGDVSSTTGQPEGTPTNFVFTDTNLSQVVLRVEDSSDPTCFKQITLPFSSCPLADVSEDLSQDQADLLLNSTYTSANTNFQQQYNYNPNEFYDFYLFPFNLSGINNTSNIFFQIQVIYRDPRYGDLNAPPTIQEFQYFLSNEVPIDNPLPDSVLSSIPNSYSEIVNIFGNPGDGSMLPLVSQQDIVYDTNPNEYQLAQETGFYQEQYYTRQIRFIANNGLIDGTECKVVSRWYSINKADKHRVPITLYYYEADVHGAVNLCLTSNTKTVYVEVFDTINSVSQDDVIVTGMFIYKTDDPTDPTPADVGIYGDDGSGETANWGGGNYTGVPQFNIGRKGREWKLLDDGTYDWDRTTPAQFGDNILDVDFEHQGILGLYLCNYGGSDTDDDTGFEINDPVGGIDTDPDVSTPGSEGPDQSSNQRH